MTSENGAPGALTMSVRMLDPALELVTALSRATVGAADGATLTLERQGQLTTVAATDDLVDRIDRVQYETRQGPCVAASAYGHQYYAPSLPLEPRWPDFVPRAIDAGYASIVSTPLILRDVSAGALNIYSRRAQAFETTDLELAQLLASHAARFLAEAEDVFEGRDAFRGALQSREVIAQSQGVHMERYGASAEMAYTALRDLAHRRETTLHQEAVALLASTRRTPPASG